MTAFTRIAAHHAKHIYTKGLYKGDAPVAQRGKRHFRVRKLGDGTYAVHFHKTDIMVVHPDDTVTLNCKGYVDRPTTTASLNTALGEFFSTRVHVTGRHNVMSFSQPIISFYNNGGNDRIKYRYYDRMVLSLDSTSQVHIDSPLKPLYRKRVNAEKVAAFNAGMEESGFKDAFKVLHAVSEPMHHGVYRHSPHPIERQLVHSEYADAWPQIVSMHTHYSQFDYKLGRRVDIKRTAPEAWKQIMADAKKRMYEVVESEYVKL